MFKISSYTKYAGIQLCNISCLKMNILIINIYYLIKSPKYNYIHGYFSLSFYSLFITLPNKINNTVLSFFLPIKYI